MRISFFEEYPSEKNLDKLRLIHFPTMFYLGTTSIGNFLRIKKSIKHTFPKVKECIYWPLLATHEGYWLSAFAKTNAIERILCELALTKEPFPVLWDAELPTLHKKLFFTELHNILNNRRLIVKALMNQRSNHPLIIAQFPKSGIHELTARIGASAFPFTNYHRLDMLYSSLLTIPNKHDYIRRVISEHKKTYTQYSVGMGLLVNGENEAVPPITTDALRKDLSVAKDERVQEVVIYRLGGLDKNYLSVLQEFTT